MFIVMEIQTSAQGEVATLINQYEEKNDAESKFHQILATASVSDVPTHTALIIDEQGKTYRAEAYVHGENVTPTM